MYVTFLEIVTQCQKCSPNIEKMLSVIQKKVSEISNKNNTTWFELIDTTLVQSHTKAASINLD